MKNSERGMSSVLRRIEKSCSISTIINIYKCLSEIRAESEYQTQLCCHPSRAHRYSSCLLISANTLATEMKASLTSEIHWKNVGRKVTLLNAAILVLSQQLHRTTLILVIAKSGAGNGGRLNHI